MIFYGKPFCKTNAMMDRKQENFQQDLIGGMKLFAS